MKIFENVSYAILREYYYEARGCYPPEDFSKDQLINVLIKFYS